MCIFSGDAEVKNTKILVGPYVNDGKKMQFTLYENQVQYDNDQEYVTMILPFPGTIYTVLNMEEYKEDVWKQVDKAFRALNPTSGGWGAAATFGSSAQSTMLKVEYYGGYCVSIATCIEDIVKANPVFEMPENILEILRQNYDGNIKYQFLLCKFVDKAVKLHPIGCISDTLPGNQLFIPTRHEHGHVTRDTESTLEPHINIQCDCCGKQDFIGDRYACIPCSFKYDLCSECYNRFIAGDFSINHDTNHVFAHYYRPVKTIQKYPNAVPVLYDLDRGRSKRPDMYDHTIYICNATIVAPPGAYSRTDYWEPSNTHLVDWNLPMIFGEGWIPDNFANIQVTQRVVIRGNFPNTDYKAAVF